MNQYSLVKLLKDINPTILKEMIGVILEVYEDGNAFEVEFIKNDGTNYEYGNESTFTINKDNLESINKLSNKKYSMDEISQQTTLHYRNKV